VRTAKDVLIIGLTIVAAAGLAFGVPLGWLWIGSQVQGGTGASSVDFSVAMLVLFGIIGTYVAVLFLAGWAMSRADPSLRSDTQRGTARSPWMRGMTDTRALKRQSPLIGGIERVFVVTTLIVSAAFWLWLLFLAGSPLPNP
jgi:hypothetical protein